jgi:transcription antitermination factor NusG
MNSEKQDVWYIAVTDPGREVLVRDHIGRRGFEALVPMWTRKRRPRSGDRKQKTLFTPRLYLPRYVFVRGDSKIWAVLDRMMLVHGVLSPHGYPLAIPQSAVDWLIANDGRVFDEDTGRLRPVTINDLVKVTSGPFCGQTVKVAFIKGKTAGVPMKVLGADRIVKFPLDQLEVA